MRDVQGGGTKKGFREALKRASLSSLRERIHSRVWERKTTVYRGTRILIPHANEARSDNARPPSLPLSPSPNSATWNFTVLCAPECPMGCETCGRCKLRKEALTRARNTKEDEKDLLQCTYIWNICVNLTELSWYNNILYRYNILFKFKRMSSHMCYLTLKLKINLFYRFLL